MKDYAGSCHCGALRLNFRTAVSPEWWPLRACQCPFCRHHGAVVTSDPAGEVAFRWEDPARIRHYRFGHRTADFLLCGECGVYVGAISTNSEQVLGVINARVFMGLRLKYGCATHMHFDGETVQAQAERRRKVWTPVR